MTTKLLSFGLAACLLGAGSARADIYSQGFETDVNGWLTPTRVASGTGGITASAGSYFALAAGDFTRYGGYNQGSAATGFYTSLDIYLNVNGTAANDTRFDWDNAASDSSGNFLRDFVFNAGFYNDASLGNRFIISASNNATRGSSYPKNPGRDPFTITTTGWYTFQDYFHESGGALDVTMSIFDASHTLLHSWDLTNPADLIGGVGGSRYGWFPQNEFGSLAIDNSRLYEAGVAPVPEPGSVLLLLTAIGGLGLSVVRKRAKA